MGSSKRTLLLSRDGAYTDSKPVIPSDPVDDLTSAFQRLTINLPTDLINKYLPPDILRLIFQEHFYSAPPPESMRKIVLSVSELRSLRDLPSDAPFWEARRARAKRSAVAALRVCRYWHELANPIFWAHVAVYSPEREWEFDDPPTSIDRGVLNKTNLRYIKSLSLVFTGKNMLTFETKYKQAFSAMQSLEYLQITNTRVFPLTQNGARPILNILANLSPSCHSLCLDSPMTMRQDTTSLVEEVDHLTAQALKTVLVQLRNLSLNGSQGLLNKFSEMVSDCYRDQHSSLAQLNELTLSCGSRGFYDATGTFFARFATEMHEVTRSGAMPNLAHAFFIQPKLAKELAGKQRELVRPLVESESITAHANLLNGVCTFYDTGPLSSVPSSTRSADWKLILSVTQLETFDQYKKWLCVYVEQPGIHKNETTTIGSVLILPDPKDVIDTITKLHGYGWSDIDLSHASSYVLCPARLPRSCALSGPGMVPDIHFSAPRQISVTQSRTTAADNGTAGWKVLEKINLRKPQCYTIEQVQSLVRRSAT